MTDTEILNSAIKNGIIDINTLTKQVEMNERKKYLEKHKHEIWQGTKDEKWYTYLPDKEKGRRLIKRKSRESINDAIVKYYKGEFYNPTIEDIYNEWIDGKMKREEIQKSTKDRYNRQYDESLSDFGKRKIKNIKEYDIEEFVLSTIYDHNLTKKGYSNLRTILYGIFRLAKKKKLISFSIKYVISDIEISDKSFRKVIKSEEDLVFSETETKKVIDYITNSKRDIIDLGILLYFKSGMRPGELSALKKEDVKDRIIHVNRTEIRYKSENGKIVHEVRDFPKTEAGIRNVIIPSSSEWILKEIRSKNPFGEYVFEVDGKRICTHQFTQRIKHICKKLNIVPKSLNKIRKTYASILIDSGTNESLIISQMGHTDIATTKKYYYKNRKDLTEKMEEIDMVKGL